MARKKKQKKYLEKVLNSQTITINKEKKKIESKQNYDEHSI